MVDADLIGSPAQFIGGGATRASAGIAGSDGFWLLDKAILSFP
jgi:hypothetical protein